MSGSSRGRGAQRSGLLAGAVSALALAAPGVASAEIDASIGSNQVSVIGAQPASVVVMRGGTPLASGTPVADPKAAGTFSVNVNGAGPPSDCFAGITPDISPGDVVQARDQKGAVIEQTTVRDIAYTATVQGASTTISGHARELDGRPLAGPLDVRLKGGGRDQNVAIDANGNFSTTLAGTDLAGVTVTWIDAAGVESTIADPVLEADGCAPIASAGVDPLARDTVNLANVASGLPVSGFGPPSLNATKVNLALGSLTINAAASLTATPNQAWSFTIPGSALATLADGTHTLTANFAPAPFALAPSQAVTVDLHAPAAPTASVAAGTYTDTQSVSLASEPGAAIFYTTDGTTPTPASQRLQGPLVVDASQTVKAIAVDAAGNPSAPAAFAYVINRPAAVVAGTTASGPAATTPAATGAAGGAATGAQLRPTAPLTVTRLTVARRISRAQLRRKGLRLSMRLPAGTRVVSIAVFRSRNGRAVGRALTTALRTRGLGGATYRVTLRDAALLRRLKPGTYVVSVAAGESRSTMSAARTVTLRVTA